MPGGAPHQIHDHAPPAKALSDDQFAELTAMLDDQHRVLVDLMSPIHEVARLMLADRDASKTQPADPKKPADGRSESEQSSG